MVLARDIKHFHFTHSFIRILWVFFSVLAKKGSACLTLSLLLTTNNHPGQDHVVQIFAEKMDADRTGTDPELKHDLVRISQGSAS